MLLMESEDWNVSVRAKNQLIEIGEPAVPSLIKEINHPDTRVRTLVITALGEIGSPEAAPALIDALRSDDAVTVIQTATALGNIRTDAAVSPLLNLLDSPDWRMRRASIVSLGKTGDPDVMERIKSMQQDQNEKVAEAAKQAVENIRNE